MNKICYIVGAGDFYGIRRAPAENDYVIAADGGYDYLERSGIRTDLVIGDFDSVKELPVHDHRITLPEEKDDTDMWAALKCGMEREFSDFLIYGGTGGRLSHTLANIQTLAWLSEHGRHGCLVGEGYLITALTDEAWTFAPGVGKVSMFAHSNEASGVNIRGMKYPLTDAVISNAYPIGISNERMGEASEISVKHGTLILLYESEDEEKDYICLRTTRYSSFS